MNYAVSQNADSLTKPEMLSTSMFFLLIIFIINYFYYLLPKTWKIFKELNPRCRERSNFSDYFISFISFFSFFDLFNCEKLFFFILLSKLGEGVQLKVLFKKKRNFRSEPKRIPRVFFVLSKDIYWCPIKKSPLQLEIVLILMLQLLLLLLF